MSKALLSICIPTFNRAEKLFYCLRNVFEATKDFEAYVEVIVSDNASDDATNQIIEYYKNNYFILRAYRNNENIGFNYNFFKLTDKFANGKYLWVIGDDDFIDKDSVKKILNILNNHDNVEFIGLNFRLQDFSNIKIESIDSPKFTYKVTTIEEVIDLQSRPENLLATFISCNIVLNEHIKDFDKSIFSKESYDNFQSVFPHSFMLARIYNPTSKGVFVSSPLMSVCIHEKSWDNKLAEIKLKHLVLLYKHFLTNNYSHLKITYRNIVIGGTTLLFNKQVDINLRKSFWKQVCLSWNYYTTLIIAICGKIKISKKFL